MALGTRCTNLAFPCPPPMSSTPTADSFLHPLCGICTSKRYQRYLSSAADTVHEFKWDFVNPQILNFLFIARADCIIDLDTVVIESSDDDVVYTPELTLIQPFYFSGTRDNDIIECFADTTAHRYWKIIINLTSSQILEFSKIYTGQLFDMGKEPTTQLDETRNNRRSFLPFRTTSSNIVRVRREEMGYVYRLEYVNIDNTTTNEFMHKISHKHNKYILLANLEYTELFNNHDVIHGTVSDVEIIRRGANINEIRFILTEMIG